MLGKQKYLGFGVFILLAISLMLAACGDSASSATNPTAAATTASGSTAGSAAASDNGLFKNDALAVGQLNASGGRFTVSVEGVKQGKFKGESLRAKNQDKIDGLAFNYAIKTPRDDTSGLPTGKRQFSPVTFTKEWGASSPQFFQALTTNEILKSVLFEFTRTNATGEEYVYYSIKLTNATVSDIHQHIDLPGTHNTGNYDGHELEDISFTFQQIEVESKDGKTMASDNWSTSR